MSLEAPLLGYHVLVVEDEYLLTEAMSRKLRKAGAIAIGPASDVAGALMLLSKVDIINEAVLDISLGRQKVYPILDSLLERGARCLFATGNDAADVPAAYASLTRCEKPVEMSCFSPSASNEVGMKDHFATAFIMRLDTLRRW